MINLDSESLQLLRAILHQHVPNHSVWLFGSRATPQCKPYSDIDLTIISKNPVPGTTLALLETALTESDLPYKVDLVDWATTDKEFQLIIQQHYEIIQ